MSLIDYVHAELSGTLGLKPQQDWSQAIVEAIASCESMPTHNTLELRARIMNEVAKRITVPETHFFRNHAQLARCAEHLSSVAQNERRVAQLWCAGSATGEEPYTLAMLVARQSGEPLETRVSISASDINQSAVEKAREATYTAWSFRGAPDWCFGHFEALSPGRVTLRPSPIRGVVSFEVESLQAGAARRKDASLDVISFRNVAIYLEEAATQALYREFARLLRPSGILAIGPSDPRPTASEFEFSEYHDDAPVFVRSAKSRESHEVRTSPRPVAPGPVLPGLVPSGPLAPLLVAPGSAARPKNARLDKSTATRLGAEGQGAQPTERNLEVAKTLAAGEPEDSTGLRILGQMHLSRGEVEEATRVLRQATFLDGDDVLTRYFFALALREGGDARQALRQLKNVVTHLVSRSRDEVLSDQNTRVGELLTAAEFLEGQWT